MNLSHANIMDSHQQNTFTVTFSFLHPRLEEIETINWALALSEADSISKLAIMRLLEEYSGVKIAQPWLDAWSLIIEYWQATPKKQSALELIRINRRIAAGEHDDAIIRQIVELVEARLKIEPLYKRDLSQTGSKRQKSIRSIFYAHLTSNETINPFDLHLADKSPHFLYALTQALEFSITKNLDLARRLGWKSSQGFWGLGMVYNVAYGELSEDGDSDNYNTGIAPSLKMLHTTVLHLAKSDLPRAVKIVDRWKEDNAPLHLRLWASLARQPGLQSADQVSQKLLSLTYDEFWNVSDYPEIATLRARMFEKFNEAQQATICSRIIKGPPNKFFKWLKNKEKVSEAKIYWSVRELLRIQNVDNTLPKKADKWLKANNHFKEFEKKIAIDEGLPHGPRMIETTQSPDDKYNYLTGKERLEQLEATISLNNNRFADNPKHMAVDWIKDKANVLTVLSEMEMEALEGRFFFDTLNEFLYAHSTPDFHNMPKDYVRDLDSESSRTVDLLLVIPKVHLKHIAEAASYWMSHWGKWVVANKNFITLWNYYWPAAVAVTNSIKEENGPSLSYIVQSQDEEENPRDLDTLNTATGRLIGLFIDLWAKAPNDKNPFNRGTRIRQLRDIIIKAPGRSGLIAKYRFIELIGYFQFNDPKWTAKYLLPPLRANTKEATILWRALGRRQLTPKTMEILSDDITLRILEKGLGRRVRRHLLFGIVINSIHSFKENKAPAIPYGNVQQILRTVEDELRALSADAMRRYLTDNSEGKPQTAALLFKDGVKPFIEQVWPQERSLVTEGISRAFANLPAAAGTAFVDAVRTVERFLVPFNCWSMLDFGLYGDSNGKKRILEINTPAKGRALLHLLDLTVASPEQHSIPHDLSEALEQIKVIAPESVNTAAYKRLVTTSR